MSGLSRDLWYYETNCGRPKYGKAKAYLYERIYLSLTQHNLFECFKLLRILPKETSTDPDLLFRFILILINSVNTDEVNKNFIIYLELFLAKLNLSKQDAFLEFLSYFIRNNRIEDAKELFLQRHKNIVNLRHRYIPYVELNIDCYRFYFDYQDWNKRISEQKVKFDYSIQGWLVNAMDALKKVTHNYEYFVLSIIKVLLYYKFDKKAYLFSSEIQRTNPDNLSAQLIHFRLLEHLEEFCEEDKKTCLSLTESDRIQNRLEHLSDINNFPLEDDQDKFEPTQYPVATEKEDIFHNLSRLDIRRPEVMKSALELDQLDNIRIIMDSLEYTCEIKNLARWQSLQYHLNNVLSSDDEQTLAKLRELWRSRYRLYWDFDSISEQAGPDFPDKNIIKDVIDLMRSSFEYPEGSVETIEDSGDLIMDFD